MACELKKQNEKYTITLIYYIQDMYDWEEGSNDWGGVVTDGEMFKLHQLGLAKQFPSVGTYKVTIEWEKGQRFSNSDDIKIIN